MRRRNFLKVLGLVPAIALPREEEPEAAPIPCTKGQHVIRFDSIKVAGQECLATGQLGMSIDYLDPCRCPLCIQSILTT